MFKLKLELSLDHPNVGPYTLETRVDVNLSDLNLSNGEHIEYLARKISDAMVDLNTLRRD